MTSAATNSTTSRCGQTWTLSTGSALTSWIEPDLTTVSSRWVWPPGPAADRDRAGRRPGGNDSGRALGDGDRAASGGGAPPRRPRLGPRRPAALEQVGGDAADRLRRVVARWRRHRRRPPAAAGSGSAFSLRPWRAPLRPACAGARGSRSRLAPARGRIGAAGGHDGERITAAPRCRRPCAPARSGSP